ncbi:hypothetical protein D6C91_10328 [Aureobasidium pullulans]|uniref:Uncharacterized protein n=1 Tax=Aureobasidium pullulans TaxID=5580 RepID=A0A4S9S6L3_AURPU|nr:hypothetical protein D6C91_10328 [Aureobasidium pullulans]
MAQSSKLWYDKPAAEWNEALPIGNGRLGAMIHGRTGTELLCLNEDSVWYGGPQDRVPKDALAHLPKLRDLVREGKHAEAEKLVDMRFCATPSGQRHYEPLGTVKIEFGHDGEGVSEYRRELDLDTAVHKTEYAFDGKMVKVEMLASVIDQVIAIRVQSEGTIEFVVRLTRVGEIEYESHEYLDSVETTDNRMVMLVTPGGYQSVRACCALGVRTDSEGTTENQGGSLVVNAKDALIVVAARTTFRHEDFDTLALEDVSAALERGADKIWDYHIQHHQSFYHQMQLTLGPSTQEDALPTDQRIKKGTTPALIALYTNYSRYLLLSSSRPSNTPTTQHLDLPANLQGLWNPSFHPAWGSKFTMNINLQMNYWGALPLNLSSTMNPLFSLLHRLALPENGGRVAKQMYGARGWCCHNNTDLWADCAPCERWTPATLWPLGGAWLCSFIWEHYLFTSSLSTLRDNFPVLQGAVEFCLDWLVEEKFPDGKIYRVTNPSLSPENTFIDATGAKGVFCRGSTADLTIISSLFEDYLNVCETLHLKPHLLREVGKTMLSLPPPSTCPKTGRLQEWGVHNYADVEAGHRHLSHLLGVYPFTCIDISASPILSRAALRSLEIRLANGGGHTSWSRAHLLCLFSRFRLPGKIAENFQALFGHNTLGNLFSSHPPFQADGNFGAAASVVECAVQSFEITGDGRRVIRILPCWPEEFGTEGEVTGVRCRGGWTVGFKWSNGKVDGKVEVRDAIDHGEEDDEEVNETKGGKEVRKGVVMFPDGGIVDFEGCGPHFC